MLRDWILSVTGNGPWESAKRCLEIGAGSGALIRAFQERYPKIVFDGLEPSAAAVALARQKGISLLQQPLSDLKNGTYDLVYSVTVIEHVASPTDSLRRIRQRLKPGGCLVLVQPTQDVPSYDLFFADHLHHFGTEHLRRYAQKTGFREVRSAVGHQWMPNFSVHLWEALESIEEFSWDGDPEVLRCESAVREVLADMESLEQTLKLLKREDRRVAAFGLGEAYWLLRTYSSLSEFPVVCGLDDMPDRPEYKDLGFPVMLPEDCARLGIQDVLLTMNKTYYDHARQRMERLGMTVHPIFH